MKNRSHVSEETSVSVLLAALLASAFVVVLPSLLALQAIPRNYADALPAGELVVSDVDRDGIGDYLDARPLDN